MLNIELQCCGLAMLMVILIIYIKGNTLDFYSRRLYLYAMISCVLCLVLDILSIVGIAAADAGRIPRWAALIVCKLYVGALFLQTYESFLYASSEFFSAGSHKGVKRLVFVGFLIGMAAIFLLPIDFYIEGRIVYSFGLSTIATYIFNILYIAGIFGMAFVSTDRASHRRRLAILIWQGSWLLAALIQLWNPSLLLVGFAAAFGMVILYAELENPHEGIDRMTGQYTANMLMEYVKDRYMHKRKFSSIYITLEQGNLHSDLEVEKAILLRSANFLKSIRKASIFRNGEMEFVLLLPDRDTMENAYESIKNGLGEAIGLPIRIHYILTPDSSVARSPEEYFGIHHYLSTESETKECYIVDGETLGQIRKYEDIKALIQYALDNHRIEVFYQPIYNVQLHKFTSAEALVRIRDQEERIVPPGVFIPIAEKNGLIIPLGEEVFRQVCELFRTGEPLKYGIEYIELNLSVAQFDQENLAGDFARIAKEYGVDLSRINLEITETASMSAKQTLLKNMHKLMGWGAHFSLDDFGTGRSNLDYFVDMPVDIIKFDYSFTQGYFTNEKTRNVMQGVIEMMKNMGLSIVSEGVETKEQLDAMCSLGVNYIQGYYFSKPIPRKDFLAFLKEKNG